MDKSTGKAVVGFIFGAAIGVAAGMLFAPASGKDTRKKLQKKTKEYSDEVVQKVEKKFDELKDFVNEVTDETKARVKKVTEEKKA